MEMAGVTCTLRTPSDRGEACSVESGTALSPRPARTSCRLVKGRSEEHTSELQSPCNLVCRLLLEKKKKKKTLLNPCPMLPQSHSHQMNTTTNTPAARPDTD